MLILYFLGGLGAMVHLYRHRERYNCGSYIKRKPLYEYLLVFVFWPIYFLISVEL